MQSIHQRNYRLSVALQVFLILLTPAAPPLEAIAQSKTARFDLGGRIANTTPSYPKGGRSIASPPSGAGSPQTYIVTNRNDSGPGSLRQSIADAVPGSKITFAVTGTITLTSGQLIIGKNLTIEGPGADLLAISGNRTYSNRVFLVDEEIKAIFDGITIRDGCVGGVGGGIASLIGAHLTVRNSIVTGNCNPGYGAGIANWGGTLIVSNSTVSANQGLFYDYGGGGLWNYAYAPDYHTYIGATLIVDNSTISNNLAYGSVGGGIYNEAGTMAIINSTIANNIADDNGGGYGSGGGIYSYGEPQISSIMNIIENCTISGNSSGSAGGLLYFGSALIFRNNIVSGNSGGDIYGTIGNAGHNLIGDPKSSGDIRNGVNGNIVGVNPLLGPLRNNGGPTMTRALLSASPAANAGNNCVLTENGCGDGNPALAADQRGMPRNGTVDIGAFERQAIELTISTQFDFDGDGKADQGVYRDGIWYLLQSRDGANAFGFGLAGDRLVPADYDGDGKTDAAIYRNGEWWVLRSTGGYTAIQWGIASDIPVPGDYDGDGKADLAVYRDGTWWILYGNGAGYSTVNWGIASDKPVPADFDGDGKTDFAVYRGGEWWVLFASGSGYSASNWGIAGDKPVPADYNGDGKADLAVYRGGEWWIYNSGGGPSLTQWGIPGDQPVPADYDGDGKADLAIYRNGEWWTLLTNDYTNNTWGIPNDVPVSMR